ncbi:MAG: flagellar basal body-associated FliL family protein [Proteobacteria bacterium]|nr:flagellar basal body-associated FliL family protein [Pseudomonadota bacterium]
MAKSSEGEPAKGGLIGFLIAVALLTVTCSGMGFFGGDLLKRKLAQPETPQKVISEAKLDPKPDQQLLQIPSLVTNLAGEKAPWVRLEASVILDGQAPVQTALAAQLAQDATSLLRTLTMQQISGPSGFQNLRQELLDRFATRTGGRVSDLTIQSMVIE